MDFFLKTFCLFIYGCAGSSCCTQAVSGCGEWARLLVAVYVFLIVLASLVAEHGPSSGSPHPRGMWDLPGSGIEPTSPSLAGEFFTTEPLGRPQ